MAGNRKVDKTTTRSPSWQPISIPITQIYMTAQWSGLIEAFDKTRLHGLTSVF
jgi:hypothetical protein